VERSPRENRETRGDVNGMKNTTYETRIKRAERQLPRRIARAGKPLIRKKFLKRKYLLSRLA